MDASYYSNICAAFLTRMIEKYGVHLENDLDGNGLDADGRDEVSDNDTIQDINT